MKQLADLDSREVLLAKIAGAIKAPLTKAAYLFAAPLAQTARLIEALRLKAEQNPSVLGGGAGTPAPTQDAPADDEAVADAVAEPEAPAADGDEPAAATTEG